ncbi:type I toxin-antitoxin system ptaRNA1 family toxin [Alcaligenes faecalis]|uniref:type I toxin-antitoxin system ptaRNA1 family toxin n=1 Tax=Alcaligenes faecalis TaxID=511 RepID=UPI000F65A829|nr:type I toxin-antitoxin system ptaRNA1 family toxin [Alcaligenes faecalis]MBQ0218552.1 type I toxin-antitoxin system ptaRNA1 family toxin [Alcaligenes faecalis]RSE60665.1 type I toxin-antitoxin system ptaRNA1 family toxin [Alcaligenes faecalis]
MTTPYLAAFAIHAAALLGDQKWLDQDKTRQISPMAEAVVNMLVVLFYQAETGQATQDDFREALAAIQQTLPTA